MEKALREFLKASLDEQLPVTIYFDHNALRGVVSAMDAAVVELRQENRRTVVLIDHVVAVTRE